jgi:hypothetical protein
MKCQWQECSNEGTNLVFRTVTGQEQADNTRGLGVILSIPKYHHKNVCDQCLDVAKETYPLTQKDIDADPDL